MRVLVVDDDPAGRYLLESVLRGGGYDIVGAGDGAEALAAARTTPVDLVVTDILMPGMDGYRLCREWKADPRLREVPFVFYTATYTDPADERFAEGLGADRFLTKPMESDRLLAEIGVVISERGVATRTAARKPEAMEETEVLREYSERLVNKLEHKIVELNDANAELKRAMEVLSEEVGVKNNLIDRLNKDINERQGVEGELRAARDALDAIVQASPFAIIATGVDGQVTVWNEAAERLLGWSAEEVVGQPNPLLGEGPAQWKPMLQRLVAGDGMPLIAVRTRRKDGIAIAVSVTAAALHDATGAVNGGVAIVQDITEQERIEQIKSDFVSVTSHELRTPLTGVLGYAELLEKTDPGAEPGRCRELATKLHERARRLSELVEQLLEVASIQAGAVKLAFSDVDVTDLLESAARSVPIDPTHEMTIEVAPEARGLLGDRDRLEQTGRLLVSNAVKYSPSGGTVALAARREGDRMLVSVSDQGIGIPAEEVPRVFERFTQVDMSSSREFEGLGLGLYLAKQVVEGHGGTISVTSTPGEGSVFTIDLPAGPAA